MQPVLFLHGKNNFCVISRLLAGSIWYRLREDGSCAFQVNGFFGYSNIKRMMVNEIFRYWFSSIAVFGDYVDCVGCRLAGWRLGIVSDGYGFCCRRADA
jgi:hypothetical protein